MGTATLGIATHWVKSLMTGVSDNENDNWAVSPISDPRDLLNLRALYSLLYRSDQEVALTVYEAEQLVSPIPIPACGIIWDTTKPVGDENLPMIASDYEGQKLSNKQKAIVAYFIAENAFQYASPMDPNPDIDCYNLGPPKATVKQEGEQPKANVQPPAGTPSTVNVQPPGGTTSLLLLPPSPQVALNSASGNTKTELPVAYLNVQYGVYYPTPSQVYQDLRAGLSAGCRHFQFEQRKYGNTLLFARWLFWRDEKGNYAPYDPRTFDPKTEFPLRSVGPYGGREFWTISQACLSDFVILSINSTANSHAAAQASQKTGSSSMNP
jgi:hypothetical protein